MSTLQKIFHFLLPTTLFAKIEEESKQWFLICTTCGTKKSIWEVGGLRYKAASIGKRIYGKCSVCKGKRWLKVEKI